MTFLAELKRISIEISCGPFWELLRLKKMLMLIGPSEEDPKKCPNPQIGVSGQKRLPESIRNLLMKYMFTCLFTLEAANFFIFSVQV